MATRSVLADLVSLHEQGSALRIDIESVGGVDAAKRVQAGEAFDLVVLASDAIDKLIASGHVVGGSRVDLVRSGVAVAVPEGAAQPMINSEAALKAAVLTAPSIGYSTGPSGTALMALFERWGITTQIADRLVQARAGVPVGSLVAQGDVALGFQQLSELMFVKGIQLLGPMPPEVQITTVFSAGLASTCTQPELCRAFLSFLGSPLTAEVKRRNGMEPAA